MSVKKTELLSPVKPTWCPGCGDYFILHAINNAIQQLDLNHEDVMVVWGVGCAGNGADFMKVYGMHALHGRALPVATGAKMANPNLKVIVIGGDGDGYGIGLSHFIHTSRRNIDLTYIVHNNQIYGLTTGQTSPTTEKGFCSKSTPSGVIEEPIQPMELALASDATFAARAYYNDLPSMTEIILKGMQHKGFSIIDCLQICPSFKRNNTEEFYKDSISPLPEGFTPDNRSKAFAQAQDKSKLWYGIFYQEEKPTYCDGLPQIAEKTPAQMYRELEKPLSMGKVLKQYV
ncbi:MAG: thiamine pyrophosphate-dependent enzyme [Candidatus Gracilibacteria bacterium]|nr:thiamine pyrophosphate-dependent enzyme [Candidatus Gracilibacteria bacterium]